MYLWAWNSSFHLLRSRLCWMPRHTPRQGIPHPWFLQIHVGKCQEKDQYRMTWRSLCFLLSLQCIYPLLYVSCCGLSRSTIQRGRSKCTILRQVRAHTTLLALTSPIWHTQASLKRRKRYMMCGLNYLYLISSFASKNDSDFIIRLGSLSKVFITKNAITV